MSKELKENLILASLFWGGIFLSFFASSLCAIKFFFCEVFLKKGKLKQPYFTSITRERIQLINLRSTYANFTPISPLISLFKNI